MTGHAAAAASSLGDYIIWEMTNGDFHGHFIWEMCIKQKPPGSRICFETSQILLQLQRGCPHLTLLFKPKPKLFIYEEKRELSISDNNILLGRFNNRNIQHIFRTLTAPRLKFSMLVESHYPNNISKNWELLFSRY